MNVMKGYQLTFFTQQDRKHGHQSLAEWLVEEARREGICGATIIAAAEGYGQHRRIHSAHFFDLADQPIEVTMTATEAETDRLFARLQDERVHVFFIKTPVEYGSLGTA